MRNRQPLGKCPLCGGVYDAETDYICEHSQKNENACKFRSGKIILQREIPAEQMKKLLAEGKTDLLNQFISPKSGKPFNAFFVLAKNGKVRFQFPPRDD